MQDAICYIGSPVSLINNIEAYLRNQMLLKTLNYHLSTFLVFQVHVTDGLKYVKDSAHAVNNGYENDLSEAKVPSSNGNSMLSSAPLKRTGKIDMLIVDVDSSDSR